MRIREIMAEDLVQDGLYEMANLYPDKTGMSMTVWVSARGRAQHDVRVKVNQRDGRATDIGNTAVVGVRPEPRVIEGSLTKKQQDQVFRWVTLNTQILVELWEGDIDFIDFASRMKPL